MKNKELRKVEIRFTAYVQKTDSAGRVTLKRIRESVKQDTHLRWDLHKLGGIQVTELEER
jgi:hypothetical protein